MIRRLRGPVVARIPGTRAGDVDVELGDQLVRLAAAGIDGLAGTVDLRVVHGTGGLVRPARRTTAGRRTDRHLAGRGAAVQREVVPRLALVQHPRWPAGLVGDRDRLRGPVRTRVVRGQPDQHLGVAGRIDQLGVGHRGAAVLPRQPAQGRGESGVVVDGDLVALVVVAIVDPRVGGVRPAGERTVDHVPVVRRVVGHVPEPLATGRPVVYPLRRIDAEAHLVAVPARVVAECVVDLPLGEVVVPRVQRVAAAEIVGVHECRPRRIGGHPQRAPVEDERQPARRVRALLAVVPDRPVVQVPLRVVLELLLPGQLGHQHIDAVLLVVPGQAVGEGRHLGGARRRVGLGTHLRVVVACLGEVVALAGGPVQPDRCPGQLVPVHLRGARVRRTALVDRVVVPLRLGRALGHVRGVLAVGAVCRIG